MSSEQQLLAGFCFVVLPQPPLSTSTVITMLAAAMILAS
jgi:hypothetical protein